MAHNVLWSMKFYLNFFIFNLIEECTRTLTKGNNQEVNIVEKVMVLLLCASSLRP